MIERSRQVGWSEAQWNRLRQAVTETATRGRVAGNVLPVYGPLPRSTHVVPSEWFDDVNWTVDDVSTAPLVEISIPVSLSSTQVEEADLSSAIQLFTRAASALARLEDWTIFNGRPQMYNSARREPLQIGAPFTIEGGEEPLTSEIQNPVRWVDMPFAAAARPPIKRRPIAWSGWLEDRMRLRLLLHNPGALGLLSGGGVTLKAPAAVGAAAPAGPLDSDNLITAIVEAITQLEQRGHPGPFICVLSNKAFVVANTPLAGTLVLPRDRIEPFLGRELLRSGAIDDRQWEYGRSLYDAPWSPTEIYVSDVPRPLVEGIAVSLAGAPMDLAVAVDPTPEFLSVDANGRYQFRVYQRFALRIKQSDAIVRLEFMP
jgi:uncharacterized linocin/CFP29 family protein